MSKHIAEWLNAYLDGELRGPRLQHVEAHLAECPDCQAELESLETLSRLLSQVPAVEFTPPERFASQVALILPQKPVATPGKKIVEVGWWMIPVGLLGIWIFVNTSFFVGDLWSAATTLGLVTDISAWLVFGSSDPAYWSATLGEFGVLRGNSLDWAIFTEAFTRSSLLQFLLQVSIALLYLSWLAIWWARHMRREHGQLLEG